MPRSASPASNPTLIHEEPDYAFYGLLETDKNAARFAKLIHKDAKEFAGFKDLVDHIAQTQPRCSCIRTLNLVTHGAMLKDGGVALHPGGRKYSSRNHGEEFGSALKDAMCSPCQINIYGCTAGAGSALFVEGLRSRTGCSIVAHATALMALGVKEGIPERRTGFGKVAATPDVAVWETADQKPPTVWPAKGGGPVQMNPPPILRDRGFSVSKLTMNSKHNRVGLLLNSLLLAGSLGACVPGLRFLLEWRAQRTIDRELCELESLKGTFIDRSTFRSSYGAPRFPVTELDFIGHGNPDRAMFNVTSLLQCRSANLYLDPDDRVEFVGRPRTTSYVTIDMSPIYVGIVEDRKFGPFSRLERLGLEFVIVALGIGFVLACKHVTLRKLRRVQ